MIHLLGYVTPSLPQTGRYSRVQIFIAQFSARAVDAMKNASFIFSLVKKRGTSVCQPLISVPMQKIAAGVVARNDITMMTSLV